MANVLNEEERQQVLALGRPGWSLRRIQQATNVRRETASAYLKAAGSAVRLPSGWGRGEPKPANQDEVITDSAAFPGARACEPYREAIDLGLSRGRNAMAIWQDLVSEYGFASSYQSVQRFVRKRRGTQTPEARSRARDRGPTTRLQQLSCHGRFAERPFSPANSASSQVATGSPHYPPPIRIWERIRITELGSDLDVFNVEQTDVSSGPTLFIHREIRTMCRKSLSGGKN